MPGAAQALNTAMLTTIKNMLPSKVGKQAPDMRHMEIGQDNLFIGCKASQMQDVAIEISKSYPKTTFIISPQYQYELKHKDMPAGLELSLVPYCVEKEPDLFEADYRHRISEIVRLKMIPSLMILENCPFNVKHAFDGHFNDCTVIYIFHSGYELKYLRMHNVNGVFVFNSEDVQETFKILFDRELSKGTARDVASLAPTKHIFLSCTFGIPSALR